MRAIVASRGVPRLGSVLNALSARGGWGRRLGCGSAAAEENREQAKERQCNQVFLHYAKETDQSQLADGLLRDAPFVAPAHSD